MQRERCRLESAEPAPASYGPVRLGDLIPDVLKKTGVPGDDWLFTLQEEWPGIVGADIAAHARPLRLERGLLTVGVDHSIWLDQLSRYSRRTILKTLQDRFGPRRIVDIRLQLDAPSDSARITRC